ncbi:MAG: hypothetical protein H6807_07665 [Planctomycetes bacterium]|nr:hypothetical protein [Planctomycetota bacterium]
MNRNEFDQLMQLVLDGEADEADVRRFEAAIESSSSFRDAHAFELRLRARVHGALEEAPDQIARARVLSGFRAALEAERPAAARPGWRRFLIPAATAAALLLAFWLGWRSGDRDQGPGRPVVDDTLRADLDRRGPATDVVGAVNVAERYFRDQVDEECKRIGCPKRSAMKCLSDQPDSRVFADGCGVDCKKRMEAAHELAARCLGGNEADLGLPEGFELVGWRVAQIELGDHRIRVPHFVFLSDSARVSAYVLCDSECASITEGLHQMGAEDARGETCLWGCPQRGLIVRRIGQAWVVISSEIAMDRLAKIAAEF